MKKPQHRIFFVFSYQDLRVNATHLSKSSKHPEKGHQYGIQHVSCILAGGLNQSVVSVQSLVMPQGADWTIIDGQEKKKVCFLTLVNQVNGPLGGRSRVPNGLIRKKKVDYRNEHKVEGHWLTHLCLPPSVLLLPRTHRSLRSWSCLMSSTSQTSPLALQEHWLKCWFSFLVWNPISRPTDSSLTIIYWLGTTASVVKNYIRLLAKVDFTVHMVYSSNRNLKSDQK